MIEANERRAETLNYIESMLQQLNVMARAEHLTCWSILSKWPALNAPMR